MDRAFERAFTKVHAGVAAAIPDPEAKQAAKVQSEEDRLRQETAPITAADAVQRIALAFRDGDYFRCAREDPINPSIRMQVRAVLCSRVC
jgi:hypothetical protein